ncbi:MAG: exo-alpha-sialidase, partial [Chloroflexi bacterium]|nr:exo-alpha-sialidase [Chloroflexota bacterium]
MAGYRLYSAGNRFAHLLLALMLLCVVLPRLAQAKALPAAPAMTVAGQEPTEDMRASGTASLPPVQVTRDTASDTDPSLTQTDDGKLWVVWSSSRSGNQDIWYSTSIDSRATWSAAIQLTTHASDDRSPAITQGADGKLWVTWHSSRSGNNDIWYKTSNDAGNTWSVDRQFTTSPASDESPDVFRASDGRLCMVWQSSLGNSDIWYTASVDNGATWSAASQLTTDPGSDVSPTVTQTADGWLWVVWTRWLGRGDLWYRTSSDNGSTWSTESMLSSTAYGEFGGPSIAQAGDGTVWLMWSSY